MNKLTCVISFRNEGEEIYKTVKSIRETSLSNPDIILVNDCSEDSYDYESVAKEFKCKYVKHDTPFGASLGKQSGVDLCETPYFILLDGHMRFYEMGWDDYLVRVLEDYPDSVVCGNCIPIKFDDEGKELHYIEVLKSYGKHYGAIIKEENGNRFKTKWSYEYIKELEPNIYQIECILGGCYSSSKEHWNSLGGYHGLHGYGYEEPYISLKNTEKGGKNLTIHNLYIGHLFRKEFPYSLVPGDTKKNIDFLNSRFKKKENPGD